MEEKFNVLRTDRRAWGGSTMGVRTAKQRLKFKRKSEENRLWGSKTEVKSPRIARKGGPGAKTASFFAKMLKCSKHCVLRVQMALRTIQIRPKPAFGPPGTAFAAVLGALGVQLSLAWRFEALAWRLGVFGPVEPAGSPAHPGRTLG